MAAAATSPIGDVAVRLRDPQQNTQSELHNEGGAHDGCIVCVFGIITERRCARLFFFCVFVTEHRVYFRRPPDK